MDMLIDSWWSELFDLPSLANVVTFRFFKI